MTWVGFWINAVLMILKLVFGYYGKSDALVADGFHSMSDFGTDFIVLSMVGIAYKRADSSHPYGHGKFETFGIPSHRSHPTGRRCRHRMERC